MLKRKYFVLLFCANYKLITNEKKLTFVAIWAFYGTFLAQNLGATTVVWNLDSKYGVTQSGIADAISDARAHFSSNRNDTIII